MAYPSLRIWLPALVVLACSACAGRGSLSPLLSSDWRPSGDQTCTVLAPPAWASGPDALVDEEFARLALAQAGSEAGERGHVVLDVRYDDAGVQEDVSVLETDLPDELVEGVEGWLVQRLPAGGSEEETRGGRGLLRVEVGDRLEITAGGIEYCACAVLNAAQFRQLLGHETRGLRRQGVPPGRYRVVVLVRASPLGEVLERRLEEPNVHPLVNQAVWRALDQLEVAPAVFNRSYTAGWSRLPVIINVS